MREVRFDAFESKHLGAASGVYAACFNSPPWEDGWSVETASHRLSTLLSFPNAIGCVASRGDRLVALAVGHSEPWVDGEHFYLNELCVDPGAQREGIGGALLSELTRRLDQRGTSHLYLLTERASPAEAFFRRFGFELDADATKLWRRA